MEHYPINQQIVQPFGYAEMFEWSEIPVLTGKLGKFVAFDPNYPEKIKLLEKGVPIGVTTVNAVTTSDDPQEWHAKNMVNEYGDTYMRKEKLAVGIKEYDDTKEMAFIKTQPWIHMIPIQNPQYSDVVQYIPRTLRKEWQRITILGKAIVEDNGECVIGGWCKPYRGKLTQKQGTAIPADDTDNNKYYVMDRLSEKTILILFK